MTDYANQGRDPVDTDTNAYYSRIDRAEKYGPTDEELIEQKIADIRNGAFLKEELQAMAISEDDEYEVREAAADELYDMGYREGLREAADRMAAVLERGGK